MLGRSGEDMDAAGSMAGLMGGCRYGPAKRFPAANVSPHIMTSERQRQSTSRADGLMGLP